MVNETQQEMSLQQWVERLPSNHLAHKEYVAQKQRIRKLEAANDRIQTALAAALAKLEGS